MIVSAASLTQLAATRAALAETLLLKAGQVLEALVLGGGSDGTTKLKLGDQLLTVKLPAPLPPGTALQLQVKVGGAAPELALLKQTLPGAPAEPSVVRAAASGNAEILIARPVLPPPIAESSSHLVSTRSSGALSVGPATTLARPAGLDPQPTARPPSSPEASPVMRSATAGPPASNGGPRMAAPTAPPPTMDRPASAAPTNSAAADTAGDGSRPILPATAEEPSPGTPSAPAALQPANARQLPAETPAPQVQLAVHAQNLVRAPQPAAVTNDLPLPELPALQTGAAANPVPSVVRSAAVTGGASIARPEMARDASGPLPVAQAMPKAAVKTVDVQRVVPSRPAPPLVPVPPATPRAAVLQALPQAIAKQDSLGPLLVTLAAAVARPSLLPEPLARLAREVLAQRVIAPEGRVAPDDLAGAISRSGVLLEAKLADGRVDPSDLKSLLLALRDRLAPGPREADPPRREPAAPPLKGLPLRAERSDAPSLPDPPREALRLLHDQSDAAVSRIKLAQIASLPDGTDPAKANGPLLRLELPFLIGHELVMAQIEVGRDGGRRGAERRRGWSLKFALNSAATGEVGADVGLLGTAVNVALWAADPETADAFSARVPDLAAALEAAGLQPAAIKIRRAPPAKLSTPVGNLLDSVS